jgi:hypothetical protein
MDQTPRKTFMPHRKEVHVLHLTGLAGTAVEAKGPVGTVHGRLPERNSRQ